MAPVGSLAYRLANYVRRPAHHRGKRPIAERREGRLVEISMTGFLRHGDGRLTGRRWSTAAQYL